MYYAFVETFGWIRRHAPYLVDGASVLLAVVGVIVSVIPTDKMARPYRVIYRLAVFVLLAILALTVVIANTWQRGIQDAKENNWRIKQDEKSKENSDDLKSIINFVGHLPKQSDISNVFKTLLQNEQKNSEPTIPDATLLVMADNVRRQMAAKISQHASDTEAAWYRLINNPNNQSDSEPLEVRRKRLESVTQQIGINLLSDHIVQEATAIRDLMLKRFGNTEQTKRLTESIEVLKSWVPGG